MRSFDHPKRVAIREHLGLIHDHPMRAVAGREEELIKVHVVPSPTEGSSTKGTLKDPTCLIDGALQVVVVRKRCARGSSHESPSRANLVLAGCGITHRSGLMLRDPSWTHGVCLCKEPPAGFSHLQKLSM